MRAFHLDCRCVRLNPGEENGHVELGNLSLRSRGFDSLPAKASQPAGSESCTGAGNMIREVLTAGAQAVRSLEIGLIAEAFALDKAGADWRARMGEDTPAQAGSWNGKAQDGSPANLRAPTRVHTTT